MKSNIPKINYTIIQNKSHKGFGVELKKFNYAVSNYGFFLLENTPINEKIINNIFDTYNEFFSLPFEEKNKINMANTSSNRGWGAPKGEQVNQNFNPDYKEIFDSGPYKEVPSELKGLDYYSKNLWPAKISDFEKTVNNYFDICSEVSLNILSFIEYSLSLTDNFFKDKFENPMSLLRCNYYPPRDANMSKKDYGIAPHTDYGCLTLLLTDQNPGLEIKNPNNEWELVIPEKYDLIVNFGDLIQIWSENKIKATSHRVFGNDKERFSIPFFFNPQFDTVISEVNGITAGKYLSNRYNNTYSHQKIKSKL